jgi:hypothetical protein
MQASDSSVMNLTSEVRFAAIYARVSVVRRSVRVGLEGMPTRAIARLLTRERVPTKHDRHPGVSGRKAAGAGAWHAKTIHSL